MSEIKLPPLPASKYRGGFLDDEEIMKYARAAVMADREQSQARITALEAEIEGLHTTMMAAAVEIQEHWGAHCDEDGYGPANLMRRLERRIDGGYGYSAKTVVQMDARIAALKARIKEQVKVMKQARSTIDSLREYYGKDRYWHLNVIEVLDAAIKKEMP